MLELKNISTKLGDFILKPVNFEIKKGEYFVILGLSGVGKSVLLETIAGLAPITDGEIILNGKNIEKEKIQKRKIGLVYQDNNLFPHMSVKDNVQYPFKAKNIKNSFNSVEDLLNQVDAFSLIDRDVKGLSGGESQRVSLARTLASEPELLLLDEPISSLDIQSKGELRKLLRKINRNGQTILHVTHDYEEAVSLADRIAVMEDGNIIQIDTPDKIFSNPKSEFVANFVGIKNFIRGELTLAENTELKIFRVKDLEISVATEKEIGECYLMLDIDDITVSNQTEDTSARNHFKGVITDIARAALGYEISVDIGFNIIALVTKESVNKLKLEVGKNIVVNFKATACKIFN